MLNWTARKGDISSSEPTVATVMRNDFHDPLIPTAAFVETQIAVAGKSYELIAPNQNRCRKGRWYVDLMPAATVSSPKDPCVSRTMKNVAREEELMTAVGCGEITFGGSHEALTTADQTVENSPPTVICREAENDLGFDLLALPLAE